MKPTLVIFAKDPLPGRVKTRLAADIGAVAAAGWYRRALSSAVRRVAADPRWRTVLAVAPDRAVTSRLLPRGPLRWPQGPGDLGDRMGRALAAFGPGPVAIVGSDIPGLDRTAVAEGFALLRGADAVIGPAGDGGYWLIGLRRGGHLPRGLFGNVRWSGPHAMADTLAGLRGLRVARTRMLGDVDTVRDLPRSQIR